MRSRFPILFSLTNAVIALPHILPPLPQYFILERALLAVSRSLQGPLEFAAFSILSTLGLLTPLSIVIAIAAIGALAALLGQAMWHGVDEVRVILVCFVVLYLAIGIAATYAGDVAVGAPSTCRNLPAPTVEQKVLAFPEIGWEPGEHYFLMERDPGLGRWRQVKVLRLDLPNERPCEQIQDIYPKEGIEPDAA